MKKLILSGYLLVMALGLSAQDSLFVSRFNSLFTPGSDRVIDSLADALIPQLTNLLKHNSPANFDFGQLPRLGMVESPDGAFRLYVYNILYRDGTARHFGYIQRPVDGGFEVTFLNDRREEVKSPNFEVLDASRWYGALYYQVVPVKVDGKTLYTLLGNSYNDLFTTRKVAEVMELTPEGVRFGEPIFFDGRQKASRVIFEYSARVTMTLKYFANIKMIVFDHLVSSVQGSRDFQFFGPDGSQDGFKFENNLWTLQQDIDFKQPKQPKPKRQFKVSKY